MTLALLTHNRAKITTITGSQRILPHIHLQASRGLTQILELYNDTLNIL